MSQAAVGHAGQEKPSAHRGGRVAKGRGGARAELKLCGWDATETLVVHRTKLPLHQTPCGMRWVTPRTANQSALPVGFPRKIDIIGYSIGRDTSRGGSTANGAIMLSIHGFSSKQGRVASSCLTLGGTGKKGDPWTDTTVVAQIDQTNTNHLNPPPRNKYSRDLHRQP